MPTDNELLTELVGLLKRSPGDQINEYIAEADLHGWAKPRYYNVPANTERDFGPIKASFVRIVAEMRAGFFRSGGGDFGVIYINGGKPIPFPDCPEHTGGAVEDSTTNVDATVAHVATFRMPIYHLRVDNTNAYSHIQVFMLDVGEYEQHGETRLDTFDTNQKLILDELQAANVLLGTMDADTGSMNTDVGGINTMLSTAFVDSSAAGYGFRNWPGT